MASLFAIYFCYRLAAKDSIFQRFFETARCIPVPFSTARPDRDYPCRAGDHYENTTATRAQHVSGIGVSRGKTVLRRNEYIDPNGAGTGSESTYGREP